MMGRLLPAFVSWASVALATIATAQAALHKAPKRDVLPDYAITYSPYTYLHSAERCFLSDIAVHLNHTVPEIDYVAIINGSATVDTLNNVSSDAYLTSENDVKDLPAWLVSAYGKPDSSGYSVAPGTIIAAQKNETTVDVFYFHFYSFNYRRSIVAQQFDDHVGDWEHVMVRFVNGEPYAIYLSQHGGGSAYYWDVMSFNSSHPVTYVANGSHANYATAGTQDYTVALSLVTDVTDAGYGWDITQNYRAYWYDVSSGTFSTASGASTGGDEEAGETATWLQWGGKWGDQQYPDDYPGQYCVAGHCHYENGPTGPVAKNLGRTAVRKRIVIDNEFR